MFRHKETILVGWKEIENNICLTRRTLIARGFPVYRTGRRGERVYAALEELQRHLQWLAKGVARVECGCLKKNRLGRRLRIRRAHRLRGNAVVKRFGTLRLAPAWKRQPSEWGVVMERRRERKIC